MQTHIYSNDSCPFPSVTGICNPDFLVMYGYYPSKSEVGFKKLTPRRKKKKKESLIESKERFVVMRNSASFTVNEEEKEDGDEEVQLRKKRSEVNLNYFSLR